MSVHARSSIATRISCALLASLGASGCARESEATPDDPATRQYVVVSPRIEDVVVERAYVADVRAARYAELRTRFKGVIEAVAIDEGDDVREGQVLFTIKASARAQDVTIASAAVAGAEAELRAAELELENTKVLAESNIVSPAELARVQAKVDLRRASVDRSKAIVGRSKVEMARSRIRAPFDGVVHRLRHKAGSLVDEDVALTTVSDSREVVAYFAISEREYLEYARASDRQTPVVQLALADGTMFPHEGVIDAVGGEIDADTGTLSYRARFPNSDRMLKHGSSGKVVLKTKIARALTVPQRSTFETQGSFYVYVVEEGNVVRARKVEVTGRTGDLFIVSSGLQRADKLVLEGVHRLRDGVHIEPISPTVPAAPRS